MMKGEEIERESMRIIEEEIGNLKDLYNEKEWSIVKRVIHTTADYDFASNNRLIFNKGIEAALNAIKNKCNIVTDTDIMRIISLVGSLFQVIKTTYNNPNDTRIQFIEKLLEEIKKSFEEKNQK